MRSSLRRPTNARPFSPVSSIVYAPTLPAALGWDSTHWPITGKVTEFLGTQRSVAALGLTAESVFDAVSTARSAPSVTYYVDGSGSDSNNGLTFGAAVQHIWKAVLLANAGGVPAKIIVTPGVWFRTFNPWYNGGTGVVPAVDIAFVANSSGGTGGRVVTGTFDSPGTPSRDATNTNTYSFAVSSVNRVCDMVAQNRFGNYVEFTNVATAALCNAMPDSWALVSGTLYVNRRDQQAVTQYNTRVYRPATKTISVTTAVNIYLENFDFEGGSSNGVLEATLAAGATGRFALVAKNCSFKYGGGTTDTAARSVSVDSWQGIAAFFNCAADAGWSDNWNFHNAHTNAMYVLTVNCTGADPGRAGSQSNNNWTSHENVIGIDIAGRYEAGRGGSLRSINSSATWFSGTVVKDDYGDISIANGSGAMRPTLVRVDDTAQYWMERCRLDGPGGCYAYTTGSGTATIYRRDCWPVAAADYGPGTFSTY